MAIERKGLRMSKVDADLDVETEDERGSSNLNGAGLVTLAVMAIVVIGVLVFYHFQLGLNIPYLNIQNSNSAAYWGQIGDFVGGVLNPVLSFIALLAVVLSLRSQASELKVARAEAKVAQRIQAQQTKIFKEQSKLIERQSFETVFFGLLQLHAKNVETAKYYQDGRSETGLSAFETYVVKCNVGRMPFTDGSKDNHASDVLVHAEIFYDKSNQGLGHYFRTLFEIIAYIDNYGSPRRSPFELKLVSFESFLSQDESVKKTYAGIVSATFSSAESECLLLYCLSPKGKGLKLLCEKYGLLKYLPDRQNQNYAKALFKGSAFE